MKEAIKHNPKFKPSYDLDFIEIAIYANKISEAETLIKNYLQLNPRSSHPYLFAGLFYVKIGKEEKALKYFEEGISRNKIVSTNQPYLYEYAVDLFIKDKKFDLARQALDILVSFDPFDKRIRERLNTLKQLS